MYEFIGERLRKTREYLGISQKSLGMSLGLSDKAISSYESGRTLPPIETLFKMAKELRKPVSFFISDVEDDSTILERIIRIEDTIKILTEDLHIIKDIELKSIENSGIIIPPNVPVNPN